MSLPNQNKNWPGTQTPSYSYDRNAKPQAPDCDLDSMHQFNDNESAASFGTDSYYEPSFDKWNNVVVNDDRGLHCEATAGTGQAGDRQFASNSIRRSCRYRIFGQSHRVICWAKHPRLAACRFRNSSRHDWSAYLDCCRHRYVHEIYCWIYAYHLPYDRCSLAQADTGTAITFTAATTTTLFAAYSKGIGG